MDDIFFLDLGAFFNALGTFIAAILGSVEAFVTGILTSFGRL